MATEMSSITVDVVDLLARDEYGLILGDDVDKVGVAVHTDDAAPGGVGLDILLVIEQGRVSVVAAAAFELAPLIAGIAVALRQVEAPSRPVAENAPVAPVFAGLTPVDAQQEAVYDFLRRVKILKDAYVVGCVRTEVHIEEVGALGYRDTAAYQRGELGIPVRNRPGAVQDIDAYRILPVKAG